METCLIFSQEAGNNTRVIIHAGDRKRTIAKRFGEAAMTITMASDVDFKLTAVSDVGIANGSNPDPMGMIEQLPEISVPIGSLVHGFHLRHEGTDIAHVRLLADAAGSVELPSILVQKRGSRIIDGMHRIEVAKLRGEWHIAARIVDCTDDEALVLAIKSNTLHGLPLTRADRISSAKRILGAHADWSDRAVAGITGLSAKAIASLRNCSIGDTQFDGKRLGRDGKRRPIMPAEGRRRAAEYINAYPEASLREVARETDVSLGTAHDVRERIRRGADHAAGAPVRPLEPVAGTPAPAATTVSPSPVRVIQGAGGRHAHRLAWPMISGKLAADPALRYTDGGRAFLRWMAMHSMQADEWREFIDAIPQHWLEDVSRTAAAMSEEWRQFAERLGSKREAAS
jgi:ParB-like chromosome segregation protein Spo0J